jgi:hypothetical protein
MRLETRISNLGQLLKAQDASDNSSGALSQADSPSKSPVTRDLISPVDGLLEMSNFIEM